MGTTDWNWCLVENFIDDSLHERQWADRPSVDGLAVNIMTAFNTQIPHESMYIACDLTYPERYRTVVIIILVYTELFRCYQQQMSGKKFLSYLNQEKFLSL